MENKPDLKPCPFCGSKDVFVERSSYSSCFVQCNDCLARGPASEPENDTDLTYEEENDLPEGHQAGCRAWNARPNPVDTPAVAASREAVDKYDTDLAAMLMNAGYEDAANYLLDGPEPESRKVLVGAQTDCQPDPLEAAKDDAW